VLGPQSVLGRGRHSAGSFASRPGPNKTTRARYVSSLRGADDGPALHDGRMDRAMGSWRPVQQRIAGIEMPHLVAHFLVLRIRDPSIGLVRGAGEFSEVDLFLDRVQVDADEVEIRGNVACHPYHGAEVGGT
jgi:hypothetical protein